MMSGVSMVTVALLHVAAVLLGQSQPPDYTQDCTTAACHGPLAKGRSVHPPIADDACDACHEPEEGTTHKFAFTEEGGELCLQCHDEFEGDTVHEPVASGECTACHNPHASQGDHLLMTTTVGETCLECHDEPLEDLKFQHGPVATGACTICHDPHATELGGLLKAEGTALCAKCHKPMIDRLAQLPHVHPPATEDCLNCHNPHGGADRFNLNDTPPDLCTDCHDDVAETIEDATVSHDAVTKDRACVNCHDPHATKADSLLIAEPMKLCLSCHNEQLESDGGKLLNIAKLLADNENHHGPIRDEDCTSCHLVHGGENFRMLMEAYPAKFYAPFDEENYSLCFECHEIDLVLEPETDELTNFRNGERNLHFVHVNREIKGRTCRACHNAHASRNPKHITDTVPFGEWELPINAKLTENGGSCQPGCHKRYEYNREQAVVNIPP